jgi:hypothetical protein
MLNQKLVAGEGISRTFGDREMGRWGDGEYRSILGLAPALSRSHAPTLPTPNYKSINAADRI